MKKLMPNGRVRYVRNADDTPGPLFVLQGKGEEKGEEAEPAERAKPSGPLEVEKPDRPAGVLEALR